ncbi:hypothetical protein ABH927_004846 [Planotetraspora sp. GP83]
MRELRRANEILKAASAFRESTRPTPAQVNAFIDAHRDAFGVEPICRVLEHAPSTYYAARSRPPSAASARCTTSSAATVMKSPAAPCGG